MVCMATPAISGRFQTKAEGQFVNFDGFSESVKKPMTVKERDKDEIKKDTVSDLVISPASPDEVQIEAQNFADLNRVPIRTRSVSVIIRRESKKIGKTLLPENSIRTDSSWDHDNIKSPMQILRSKSLTGITNDVSSERPNVFFSDKNENPVDRNIGGDINVEPYYLGKKKPTAHSSIRKDFDRKSGEKAFPVKDEKIISGFSHAYTNSVVKNKIRYQADIVSEENKFTTNGKPSNSKYNETLIKKTITQTKDRVNESKVINEVLFSKKHSLNQGTDLLDVKHSGKSKDSLSSRSTYNDCAHIQAVKDLPKERKKVAQKEVSATSPEFHNEAVEKAKFKTMAPDVERQLKLDFVRTHDSRQNLPHDKKNFFNKGAQVKDECLSDISRSLGHPKVAVVVPNATKGYSSQPESAMNAAKTQNQLNLGIQKLRLEQSTSKLRHEYDHVPRKGVHLSGTKIEEKQTKEMHPQNIGNCGQKYVEVSNGLNGQVSSADSSYESLPGDLFNGQRTLDQEMSFPMKGKGDNFQLPSFIDSKDSRLQRGSENRNHRKQTGNQSSLKNVNAMEKTNDKRTMLQDSRLSSKDISILEKEDSSSSCRIVVRQCLIGKDIAFGIVGVHNKKKSPNSNGIPDGQGLVTIRMMPDEQGRFGFNVKGGADQGMPIIVSRVAPGTPADNSEPRLNEGDQVLFINGRDVSQHTHEQVVMFIKASRETHSMELVLVVRPNVYTSEDPAEEPEFNYMPETHQITGSANGATNLELSLALLQESLDSGAALAQFEQLYRKKPGMTMNAARLEVNIPKNRYRDISPYDQTRVILKGGSSGDYINANYVNMEIPGSGIVNRYIAAQGPLQITCIDYWQMIWEQQSTLVVMLTTKVEKGRVKCHQYWPDLYETEEHGQLQITCVKEEETTSFAFRELNLMHMETHEERQISHMQYIAWPDHGVPDDPADFLEFVVKVRQKRTGIVEPTIVHCSAGIGRTGVLITMETAMCLIESNQPVYPLSIVRQMRDQRAMLIQTASQYKFVCEAILKVFNEGIVKPLPDYQR